MDSARCRPRSWPGGGPARASSLAGTRALCGLSSPWRRSPCGALSLRLPWLGCVRDCAVLRLCGMAVRGAGARGRRPPGVVRRGGPRLRLGTAGSTSLERRGGCGCGWELLLGGSLALISHRRLCLALGWIELLLLRVLAKEALSATAVSLSAGGWACASASRPGLSGARLGVGRLLLVWPGPWPAPRGRLLLLTRWLLVARLRTSHRSGAAGRHGGATSPGGRTLGPRSVLGRLVLRRRVVPPLLCRHLLGACLRPLAHVLAARGLAAAPAVLILLALCSGLWVVSWLLRPNRRILPVHARTRQLELWLRDGYPM